MAGPLAGVAATRSLDRRDVDGLRPLVAGLRLVGDAGTLGERAVAVADDAGVMDEQVLARIVRGDEAEALVIAEPLDGSSGHYGSSVCCVQRTRRKL